MSSLEISTGNDEEYHKIDSLLVKGLLNDVQDEFRQTFKDSLPKGLSKITKFTQFSKDKKSGIHIESPNTVKEVKVFTGKRASDSL